MTSYITKNIILFSSFRSIAIRLQNIAAANFIMGVTLFHQDLR